MFEFETTAVDPVEEKQETTTDEEPEDADPFSLSGNVCPVLTVFSSPEDMSVRGCMGSDCAWHIEGRRKEREPGCSIRVLAEAVSDLKTMARKRNWGR